MNANYATGTTAISAMQDDPFARKYVPEAVEYKAHQSREAFFERIEESTFDAVALEWWEDEGASAYGVDDEPEYVGDELPYVIDVECYGDDMCECGCVAIDSASIAADYGIDDADDTGDDLVILALRYSNSEYGSWERNMLRERVSDAIGYFADSFLNLSNEATAHYRQYLYRVERIGAYLWEFEAVKSRLMDIPMGMGYAEFAESVGAVSSRLGELATAIESEMSLRDHHHYMARLFVADLIRADADNAAWLAEFDV
jgi:hypothetical protein